MPRPRRSLLLTATLLLLSGGAAGGGEPPPPFPAAAEIDPALSWAGTEDYTVDTLWEKIDGEAELYRLHGLSDATFSLYEVPGDPDSSLEVGLYRLPSPLAAFGLFASFRSPGAAAVQAGNGAVAGDYQGFLWHGSAFVVADAFGSEGFRARVLPLTLRAVASLMGEPPPLPALLPVMERTADRDSVRFRPDHLLGSGAFPPGLEGRKGGATLLLSTAPLRGPEDLDRIGASLSNLRRETWDGTAVLVGEAPYLGTVALALRGGLLAGAASPSPPPDLRPLFIEFLDSLPAGPPPVDVAPPALR